MKSELEQHVRSAIYKEQAVELKRASALSTNAAIFDLKKRFLQGCVQLDGAREHPLVLTSNARISILFGKVQQATFPRPVNTLKTLSILMSIRFYSPFRCE
jgi:hypothetical protein